MNQTHGLDDDDTKDQRPNAGADDLPEQEQYKVMALARIFVAIYGVTIGLAFWTGSNLPLMVIGLPRLYGA